MLVQAIASFISNEMQIPVSVFALIQPPTTTTHEPFLVYKLPVFISEHLFLPLKILLTPASFSQSEISISVLTLNLGIITRTSSVNSFFIFIEKMLSIIYKKR